MVVLTALNSTESWRAQALLDPKTLAHFADLEVIAAGEVFPAHRAVLAAHSSRFRSNFEDERRDRIDLDFSATATTRNHGIDDRDDDDFEYVPRPKKQVHIQVPRAADEVLRAGWMVCYRYCYGIRVPLDTAAALAAVQVAREYRFDELTVVLDAYLRGGGVDPKRCTTVFAAAIAASADNGGGGGGGGGSRGESGDVIGIVRDAAWRVMKERFGAVREWELVPYLSMVRLVKLNDLCVESEMDVWRAVESWIVNCARGDVGLVNGLVKLVRFPTMTQSELSQVEKSKVIPMYPSITRFVRRGLAKRDGEATLLDCSPSYRRRRMDALTFSDHIPAWSTLAKPVHTSTRYFAGALWRIVVDPTPTGVGLYVAVLSEESQGEVDVCFDVALFVVSNESDESGKPILVRKQANGVRFTRSGQRAGFPNLASRHVLEMQDSPLVRNDALCIGASIRLKGKRNNDEPVPGITCGVDDTAEMVTF